LEKDGLLRSPLAAMSAKSVAGWRSRLSLSTTTAFLLLAVAMHGNPTIAGQFEKGSRCVAVFAALAIKNHSLLDKLPEVCC